jgi:hypothetical protein
MPGQQRGWCHDAVSAQVIGQQPRQSGQDRPIWPRGTWGANMAAKDRDLLAQHQDLDILGAGAADEQTQPAEQPHRDQVDQSKHHGR